MLRDDSSRAPQWWKRFPHRVAAYSRLFWTLILGYDAFLSYARTDAGRFGKALWEDLEARGLRVSFDQNDFDLGDSLSLRMRQNVRRSRAFILLDSDSGRRSSFVRDELTEAAGRADCQIIRIMLVADENAASWEPRLEKSIADRLTDSIFPPPGDLDVARLGAAIRKKLRAMSVRQHVRTIVAMLTIVTFLSVLCVLALRALSRAEDDFGSSHVSYDDTRRSIASALWPPYVAVVPWEAERRERLTQNMLGTPWKAVQNGMFESSGLAELARAHYRAFSSPPVMTFSPLTSPAAITALAVDRRVATIRDGRVMLCSPGAVPSRIASLAIDAEGGRLFAVSAGAVWRWSLDECQNDPVRLELAASNEHPTGTIRAIGAAGNGVLTVAVGRDKGGALEFRRATFPDGNYGVLTLSPALELSFTNGGLSSLNICEVRFAPDGRHFAGLGQSSCPDVETASFNGQAGRFSWLCAGIVDDRIDVRCTAVDEGFRNYTLDASGKWVIAASDDDFTLYSQLSPATELAQQVTLRLHVEAFSVVPDSDRAVLLVQEHGGYSLRLLDLPTLRLLSMQTFRSATPPTLTTAGRMVLVVTNDATTTYETGIEYPTRRLTDLLEQDVHAVLARDGTVAFTYRPPGGKTQVFVCAPKHAEGLAGIDDCHRWSEPYDIADVWFRDGASDTLVLGDGTNTYSCRLRTCTRDRSRQTRPVHHCASRNESRTDPRGAVGESDNEPYRTETAAADCAWTATAAGTLRLSRIEVRRAQGLLARLFEPAVLPGALEIPGQILDLRMMQNGELAIVYKRGLDSKWAVYVSHVPVRPAALRRWLGATRSPSAS